MATSDDAAIARDLGYLEKFFDKLEAHADEQAPAAGERLRELMGQERQRWQEIRGLIAGEAPEAREEKAAEAGPVKDSEDLSEVPPLADPSLVRPYTRAYHQGMAQLEQLRRTPPPAEPPASGLPPGARSPTGPARSPYTVGSLKPRR